MNAAETLASFPLAALALVRTAAVLDSNWQKREEYYGSVGVGERQKFAERSGGCRMGTDAKASVTNKWGQTHDVPNLYICDASIFPSPTDKTTTMPIIAFTMRNCDRTLENFRKGVHKRA